MIMDVVSNIGAYACCGERFQIAAEYLRRACAGEEEVQEYVELKGKEVYVSAQEYTTSDECKWEAHKKYIDIQCVLEGEESIGYAPVSLFPEEARYMEEYDCRITDRLDQYTSLHLYAGYFAVFFPEDGHRPKGVLDAPSKVRKLVVKIAV